MRLYEFLPDSNDGGSGEEDILHKYARMWWNGDDATQQKIEAALARMGWEIGEDEGGYDNGGVFVVRAGDDNGRSYTSWPAEDLTEGVAEGLEDNRVSFKVQKGKNKFATTLSVGVNPVGVYQYDADTGRSVAEVYPEFKGKGLGKLLVLHAIYTAAKLGLDFQEDESRTSEYDNVLDSLSSNGYIVDDDGYWYVTGEGEQYLQHSLKQGVTEGKVKLYTDPDYFGAEVDDAGFDSLPVVNISADRLVGFEPDDKMNQPKSRANVEKIVAGLKKGDKLPPLLVRKYKDGYQVLDGHHRFWAYKLSGVKSIPSRIVPDKDIEEISKSGVAEGATVTRIDSKPITDFGSSIKAYKHTDDWSQSGLDTGDDSYWKNKNLKTNTTKGLFAGDPKRTALYATGNAHETRYVEFTQNGQPIVYFDQKDLPAMRSRKTYLTVFDAGDFRQLPTGEWFSENPGKPIKQVPIGDPFKYIASQGWIVRVTDDLGKVFKQVKNMHKAGKIDHYGAEGMNESKPGVAEGDLNENSDVLAGLTDILKMAASRQAPQNPRYFAQQVKDVALQLKDNPATQKWSNYLDGVVRWADVISSGKEQYSSGFANEVHSVLGPATRAYQDALLNKQGVAEGSDPFGPQGRYVGDTGPKQITATVARVPLRAGDRVIYKPTEQRATIEALSRDGTKARIHVPSPMGGRTFNCEVADLKAIGRGSLEEKSTSQAQFRTMAAAAHDPAFARKVGIKQSVAKEFNKADKGQSYKSLPKRAD